MNHGHTRGWKDHLGIPAKGEGGSEWLRGKCQQAGAEGAEEGTHA